MTTTSTPIGLLAETCLIHKVKSTQNMIMVSQGVKLFELSSYFYRYYLFINGITNDKDILYNYALKSMQCANKVIEAVDTESSELAELFRSCYNRRSGSDLPEIELQDLTQQLTNSQLPVSHCAELWKLCDNIARKNPERTDIINWFYCAHMILATAVGFYRGQTNNVILPLGCLLAAKQLLDMDLDNTMLPVVDNMQSIIDGLLRLTYEENNATIIKSKFSNNLLNIVVAAKNSLLYTDHKINFVL